MTKALLKKILSLPTSPYREMQVIGFIRELLNEWNVPFWEDSTGNILVGVGSENEYEDLLAAHPEPLRVFVAHMDHPGFHGVEWTKKGELLFRWHGGSPVKLLKGASVWLSTPESLWGEGVLSEVKLNKRGSALESGTIRIKQGNAGDVDARSLFGGFKFRAPVWESKGVFYTKAADDLVGTFAILCTAKAAIEKFPGKFLGLLTRAEETGFLGAIGHLREGRLQAAKRKVVVVSLETSRMLPGAISGLGPIVRLGDRATVFDPHAIEVLTQVAKKNLKDKFQRRIMDGGSCEATAAIAFGLTAMGISIPLGNYHNQSFEGGPDSRGKMGPAPEFVAWKDVQGMLKLCEGLLQEGLPWNDPWSNRRKEFSNSLDAAKSLFSVALS